MNPRGHIAVIGWINIVLGAFGLFGMIVLLIIAAVIGSTSVWTDMQRELQAEGVSPEMVGAFIGLFDANPIEFKALAQMLRQLAAAAVTSATTRR